MLLFVCAPTTITDPNPPLTSASQQRINYIAFCGMGDMLPAPEGAFDTLSRSSLIGIWVDETPAQPLTAASVERLRWMDFCGMDATTMRPDGTISLADQYHFVGLIQGLGEDDEDRLLLLGVS